MLSKKSLMASVATKPIFVDDVFSCFLYTGNGSTQTITNGIDLAGESGLVWIKSRSAAYNNTLFDTARGAGNALVSNSTASNDPAPNDFVSFNSNGFSLGPNTLLSGLNVNGSLQVSWTFRKAPKFFDVVTYTGTGANRTVAHNLGSVPGMIIVKRTDTTGDWQVYHRANTAAPETDYLVLNSTAATVDSNTRWNDTLPTSTVFSLGTDATVNASGGSYVAYLFAHDAGGFGASGSDNVISCGSYTGTGAAGNAITLGYEPQWLLIKQSNSSGSWVMIDNMRGFPVGSDENWLYADLTNAESAVSAFAPTATGFVSKGSTINTNAATYIYLAIRRPNKPPESGTEVFAPVAYTEILSTQTITSGWATDLIMHAIRSSDVGFYWTDRLRGSTATNNAYIASFSTSAEFTVGSTPLFFDNSQGVTITSGGLFNNIGGRTDIVYQFRRAPGFFDVVCYTGTGAAGLTVSHNLTVVPELMIVKGRNFSGGWFVYEQSQGATKYGNLNGNNGFSTASVVWNDTAPTSSVFTLGSNGNVNNSGDTYVAYLFATLSGISKIGSYTGTGTTLSVDCGFTAGARFVLIKRTDDTGDWYVWDTARGIVSGDDPYLLLNSDAVEVTNTDYIDPLSSGFQISSTAPAAINASGGSFIFLAVA